MALLFRRLYGEQGEGGLDELSYGFQGKLNEAAG
jgi:hypothetical protein